MSRTVRGGKPAGYEYWSKRPNTMSSPGRISKTITHRAERRQNKDLARREAREL